MNLLPTEIEDACARLTRGEISRSQFVEECVRSTCLEIDCSRVGLWIFVPLDEGRSLHCLGLYDGTKHRMCRVPDESEAKAGPYFSALEHIGHVVADNAAENPATRSLFDKSLRETGVQSLMAAAFSLNGQLFGALTCTQVSEPKNWTVLQLARLKKIGSRLALALAAASPNQLDTLWSSL